MNLLHNSNKVQNMKSRAKSLVSEKKFQATDQVSEMIFPKASNQCHKNNPWSIRVVIKALSKCQVIIQLCNKRFYQRVSNQVNTQTNIASQRMKWKKVQVMYQVKRVV